MTDVVGTLGAVTVHVSDVARVRAFYRDALGLKELQYNEENQRAVYALPGVSTVLIAHRQGKDEGGRPPGTVTGILFWHPDPRAAVEQIRSHGGTVTDEVATVERPGTTFTVGCVADPDGNEFVIRSPPPPPK
jgi:predicted enzyme related to lactoylglutathione lyase